MPTEQQLATLDKLIADWLHYRALGWNLCALSCYIAARNYAAYVKVL